MFLKRLSTLLICLPVFIGFATGANSNYGTANLSMEKTNLLAPNNLSFLATPTPPKCNGGSDGKIDITILAGTGVAPFTYQYQKDNGALSVIQNTSLLNFPILNLSKGIYKIFIKDSSTPQLEVEKEVTIVDNPKLIVDVEQAIVNPTCAGGTTSMLFQASGGSAPYSYQLWKNGTQDGGPSVNGDYSNKGTGVYDLVVTDNSGCVTSYGSSINISVPDPINISYQILSQINCDNGFATVDINGLPSDPFTIEVKNTTLNKTYSSYSGDYIYGSLEAGDYIVTVSRNSCSTDVDTESFSIAGFGAVGIVTSPVNPHNLTCGGTTDLVDVSVTINGGQVGRKVRVVFDNNDGITSNDLESTTDYGTLITFPQRGAGNYSIRWNDVINPSCSGISTYVINGPSSPLAYLTDPTSTAVSCNGSSSDGKVQIAVTGGSGAKTYYVDGIGKSDPTQFSLSAGSYTIYVEDANGCKTEEKSVTITQPDPLVIALDPTLTSNVSCPSGKDGSVGLLINGGSGNYVYNLSGVITRSNVSSNSTPLISNLLAGAYSVSVIDTKGGCTSNPLNIDFDITEPAPIQIEQFEIEPIQCSGGTTKLIVKASGGGSSDINYKLYQNAILIDDRTNANSETFLDLPAATYTLKILSHASCASKDTTFTVAARKKITLINSITSINVDCQGDVGVLPLILQGESPFQYFVDGSAIAINYDDEPIVSDLAGANGLGASHSIKIVDVFGCDTTIEVTVIEPDPINFSTPDVTQLNCKNDNSGTVILSVSGGTPRYYATMDGREVNSNNEIKFSNVSAGSYNISIKDAKGCDLGYAIPVSVTEPSEEFKISTPVFDPILCYQGTTSLTVSSTGGWGQDVEYNLKGQGQDITNATGLFNDVRAGLYTLTATDSKGCTSNTSVSITEPSKLIMTFMGKFDITCKDRNDGKIVVKAEGGTSPYFYGVEGVNSSFYPFNSDGLDTVNNLTQGNYDLVVQDVNGCQSTVQTISIDEPEPITLNVVSLTDVVCFGQNDGKITLNALGGVGTKEYTIWASSVPTKTSFTGVFENLSPAEYQLSVKDGNGCPNPTPLSQIISEPKEIFITDVVSTDVKCFNGTDGAITVTANGGEPFENLYYSLKDYALAPQHSNVISDLKKGFYTVVVTDSRGKCSHQKELVFVDSPDLLEFDLKIKTDVTCHDSQDGKIERTLKGGVPNYLFELFDESGSNFLTSNSTGTFTGLGNTFKKETYYKLKVTDGNGCKISDDIKISNPDSLKLAIPIDVTPVTCNGDNNGIIALKASGGTGIIQYSLDGGVSYDLPTASVFGTDPGKYTKLAPGDYTPWVTDANSCIPLNYPIKKTVKIIEPDKLIATLTMDSISCYNTKDGEIVIHAQGGNSDKAYSYTIDNAVTWRSDSIFSDLSPNLYQLNVKDWKNCSYSLGSIDIVNPAQIVLQIDSIPITCHDDNDAQLSFKASGGVGPFAIDTKPLFDSGNVKWSNSNILDETIADLNSDVLYTYFIKDATNCPVNVINGQDVSLKTSDPVLKHTFFNPPALIVTAVDTFPERCAGERGGSLIIHANGGVLPLEFNVIAQGATNPYNSDWAVSDSVITRLKAGNYNVLVRDQHGCTPTDLDYTPKYWSIRAQNKTEMVVSVWDGEDAQCTESQDGWVKLGVRNTFENTFSWTLTVLSEFDSYKLGENIKDSTVYIYDLPMEEYTFQVTDLASLCTYDTLIVVNNISGVCEDLIIPTGFTPNNDQINDTWKIENIELFSKIKIQVYSVNGEKVLDVDGPLTSDWGWSGHLDNDINGKILPVGTYIYLIWKNYDLVGKVTTKPTDSTTVNTSDGSADSSTNVTKARNTEPPLKGNVTILRKEFN